MNRNFKVGLDAFYKMEDRFGPSTKVSGKRQDDVEVAAMHTSLFKDALKQAYNMDKTQHFSEFHQIMQPYVISLPLILHYKDKIFNLFLKHLTREECQCQETLLDLLPTLIHDLQQEALPYLDSLIRCIVSIINEDHHKQAEACFHSIQRIFKILETFIAPNLVDFFVNVFIPLLSHSRLLIRKFAAKTLGYLIKRIQDQHILKTTLLSIMTPPELLLQTLEPKETPSSSDSPTTNTEIQSKLLAEGVSHLLFSAVKNVQNQLIFHAPRLLKIYWETTSYASCQQSAIELCDIFTKREIKTVPSTSHPQRQAYELYMTEQIYHYRSQIIQLLYDLLSNFTSIDHHQQVLSPVLYRVNQLCHLTRGLLHQTSDDDVLIASDTGRHLIASLSSYGKSTSATTQSVSYHALLDELSDDSSDDDGDDSSEEDTTSGDEMNDSTSHSSRPSGSKQAQQQRAIDYHTRDAVTVFCCLQTILCGVKFNTYSSIAFMVSRYITLHFALLQQEGMTSASIEQSQVAINSKRKRSTAPVSASASPQSTPLSPHFSPLLQGVLAATFTYTYYYANRSKSNGQPLSHLDDTLKYLLRITSPRHDGNKNTSTPPLIIHPLFITILTSGLRLVLSSVDFTQKVLPMVLSYIDHSTVQSASILFTQSSTGDLLLQSSDERDSSQDQEAFTKMYSLDDLAVVLSAALSPHPYFAANRTKLIRTLFLPFHSAQLSKCYLAASHLAYCPVLVVDESTHPILSSTLAQISSLWLNIWFSQQNSVDIQHRSLFFRQYIEHRVVESIIFKSAIDTQLHEANHRLKHASRSQNSSLLAMNPISTPSASSADGHQGKADPNYTLFLYPSFIELLSASGSLFPSIISMIAASLLKSLDDLQKSEAEITTAISALQQQSMDADIPIDDLNSLLTSFNSVYQCQLTRIYHLLNVLLGIFPSSNSTVIYNHSATSTTSLQQHFWKVFEQYNFPTDKPITLADLLFSVHSILLGISMRTMVNPSLVVGRVAPHADKAHLSNTSYPLFIQSTMEFLHTVLSTSEIVFIALDFSPLVVPSQDSTLNDSKDRRLVSLVHCDNIIDLGTDASSQTWLCEAQGAPLYPTSFVTSSPSIAALLPSGVSSLIHQEAGSDPSSAASSNGRKKSTKTKSAKNNSSDVVGSKIIELFPTSGEWISHLFAHLVYMSSILTLQHNLDPSRATHPSQSLASGIPNPMVFTLQLSYLQRLIFLQALATSLVNIDLLPKSATDLLFNRYYWDKFFYQQVNQNAAFDNDTNTTKLREKTQLNSFLTTLLAADDREMIHEINATQPPVFIIKTEDDDEDDSYEDAVNETELFKLQRSRKAVRKLRKQLEEEERLKAENKFKPKISKELFMTDSQRQSKAKSQAAARRFQDNTKKNTFTIRVPSGLNRQQQKDFISSEKQKINEQYQKRVDKLSAMVFAILHRHHTFFTTLFAPSNALTMADDKKAAVVDSTTPHALSKKQRKGKDGDNTRVAHVQQLSSSTSTCFTASTLVALGHLISTHQVAGSQSGIIPDNLSPLQQILASIANYFLRSPLSPIRTDAVQLLAMLPQLSYYTQPLKLSIHHDQSTAHPTRTTSKKQGKQDGDFAIISRNRGTCDLISLLVTYVYAPIDVDSKLLKTTLDELLSVIRSQHVPYDYLQLVPSLVLSSFSMRFTSHFDQLQELIATLIMLYPQTMWPVFYSALCDGFLHSHIVLDISLAPITHGASIPYPLSTISSTVVQYVQQSQRMQQSLLSTGNARTVIGGDDDHANTSGGNRVQSHALHVVLPTTTRSYATPLAVLGLDTDCPSIRSVTENILKAFSHPHCKQVVEQHSSSLVDLFMVFYHTEWSILFPILPSPVTRLRKVTLDNARHIQAATIENKVDTAVKDMFLAPLEQRDLLALHKKRRVTASTRSEGLYILDFNPNGFFYSALDGLLSPQGSQDDHVDVQLRVHHIDPSQTTQSFTVDDLHRGYASAHPGRRNRRLFVRNEYISLLVEQMESYLDIFLNNFSTRHYNALPITQTVLHPLYLQLLATTFPKLQELSLRLFEKSQLDYITPYSKLFSRLLDPKDFRSALTVIISGFSESIRETQESWEDEQQRQRDNKSLMGDSDDDDDDNDRHMGEPREYSTSITSMSRNPYLKSSDMSSNNNQRDNILTIPEHHRSLILPIIIAILTSRQFAASGERKHGREFSVKSSIAMLFSILPSCENILYVELQLRSGMLLPLLASVDGFSPLIENIIQHKTKQFLHTSSPLGMYHASHSASASIPQTPRYTFDTDEVATSESPIRLVKSLPTVDLSHFQSLGADYLDISQYYNAIVTLLPHLLAKTGFTHDLIEECQRYPNNTLAEALLFGASAKSQSLELVTHLQKGEVETSTYRLLKRYPVLMAYPTSILQRILTPVMQFSYYKLSPINPTLLSHLNTRHAVTSMHRSITLLPELPVDRSTAMLDTLLLFVEKTRYGAKPLLSVLLLPVMYLISKATERLEYARTLQIDVEAIPEDILDDSDIVKNDAAVALTMDSNPEEEDNDDLFEEDSKDQAGDDDDDDNEEDGDEDEDDEGDEDEDSSSLDGIQDVSTTETSKPTPARRSTGVSLRALTQYRKLRHKCIDFFIILLELFHDEFGVDLSPAPANRVGKKGSKQTTTNSSASQGELVTLFGSSNYQITESYQTSRTPVNATDNGLTVLLTPSELYPTLVQFLHVIRPFIQRIHFEQVTHRSSIVELIVILTRHRRTQAILALPEFSYILPTFLAMMSAPHCQSTVSDAVLEAVSHLLETQSQLDDEIEQARRSEQGVVNEDIILHDGDQQDDSDDGDAYAGTKRQRRAEYRRQIQEAQKREKALEKARLHLTNKKYTPVGEDSSRSPALPQVLQMMIAQLSPVVILHMNDHLHRTLSTKYFRGVKVPTTGRKITHQAPYLTKDGTSNVILGLIPSSSSFDFNNPLLTGRSGSPPLFELKIASKLSQFVTDSYTSSTLARILIPYLHTNTLPNPPHNLDMVDPVLLAARREQSGEHGGDSIDLLGFSSSDAQNSTSTHVSERKLKEQDRLTQILDIIGNTVTTISDLHFLFTLQDALLHQLLVLFNDQHRLKVTTLLIDITQRLQQLLTERHPEHDAIRSNTIRTDCLCVLSMLSSIKKNRFDVDPDYETRSRAFKALQSNTQELFTSILGSHLVKFNQETQKKSSATPTAAKKKKSGITAGNETDTTHPDDDILLGSIPESDLQMQYMMSSWNALEIKSILFTLLHNIYSSQYSLREFASLLLTKIIQFMDLTSIDRIDHIPSLSSSSSHLVCCVQLVNTLHKHIIAALKNRKFVVIRKYFLSFLGLLGLHHRQLFESYHLLATLPTGNFFDRVVDIQASQRSAALKSLRRVVENDVRRQHRAHLSSGKPIEALFQSINQPVYSSIHSSTLVSVVVPLLMNFIEESSPELTDDIGNHVFAVRKRQRASRSGRANVYGIDTNLTNECIISVGVFSKLLTWNDYRARLTSLLSKLTSSKRAVFDINNVYIRLVCTLIDAFPFPLGANASELTIENNARLMAEAKEKAEQQDALFRDLSPQQQQKLRTKLAQQERAKQRLEKKKAREAARAAGIVDDESSKNPRVDPVQFIRRDLSESIIPRLFSFSTESGKTRHGANGKGDVSSSGHQSTLRSIRTTVVSALIKLVQRLSTGEFALHFPRLVGVVLDQLGRKDIFERQTARGVLHELFNTVGSDYLFYILQEMKTSFTQGHQLHLLAYESSLLLQKCVMLREPAKSDTTSDASTSGLDPFSYISPVISSPQRISQNIDYCVPLLLNIVHDDYYGRIANEKAEIGGASIHVEVKTTTSALKILNLLGRLITFTKCATVIVCTVLKELDVLKNTRSYHFDPLGTSQKVVLSCQNFVNGLKQNPSAQLHDIIAFSTTLLGSATGIKLDAKFFSPDSRLDIEDSDSDSSASDDDSESDGDFTPAERERRKEKRQSKKKHYTGQIYRHNKEFQEGKVDYKPDLHRGKRIVEDDNDAIGKGRDRFLHDNELGELMSSIDITRVSFKDIDFTSYHTQSSVLLMSTELFHLICDDATIKAYIISSSNDNGGDNKRTDKMSEQKKRAFMTTILNPLPRILLRAILNVQSQHRRQKKSLDLEFTSIDNTHLSQPERELREKQQRSQDARTGFVLLSALRLAMTLLKMQLPSWKQHRFEQVRGLFSFAIKLMQTTPLPKTTSTAMEDGVGSLNKHGTRANIDATNLQIHNTCIKLFRALFTSYYDNIFPQIRSSGPIKGKRSNIHKLNVLVSLLAMDVLHDTCSEDVLILTRLLIQKRVPNEKIIDIATRAGHLMISSSSYALRRQATELFYTYLTTFNINHKKMTSHVLFLINQLENPLSYARVSACTILMRIISQFDDEILHEHCQLLFMSLCVAIYNETDSLCRGLISKTITTLFVRLRDVSRDDVEKLLHMLFQWMHLDTNQSTGDNGTIVILPSIATIVQASQLRMAFAVLPLVLEPSINFIAPFLPIIISNIAKILVASQLRMTAENQEMKLLQKAPRSTKTGINDINKVFAGVKPKKNPTQSPDGDHDENDVPIQHYTEDGDLATDPIDADDNAEDDDIDVYFSRLDQTQQQNFFVDDSAPADQDEQDESPHDNDDDEDESQEDQDDGDDDDDAHHTSRLQQRSKGSSAEQSIDNEIVTDTVPTADSHDDSASDAEEDDENQDDDNDSMQDPENSAKPLPREKTSSNQHKQQLQVNISSNDATSEWFMAFSALTCFNKIWQQLPTQMIDFVNKYDVKTFTLQPTPVTSCVETPREKGEYVAPNTLWDVVIELCQHRHQWVRSACLEVIYTHCRTVESCIDQLRVIAQRSSPGEKLSSQSVVLSHPAFLQSFTVYSSLNGLFTTGKAICKLFNSQFLDRPFIQNLVKSLASVARIFIIYRDDPFFSKQSRRSKAAEKAAKKDNTKNPQLANFRTLDDDIVEDEGPSDECYHRGLMWISANLSYLTRTTDSLLIRTAIFMAYQQLVNIIPANILISSQYSLVVAFLNPVYRMIEKPSSNEKYKEIRAIANTIMSSLQKKLGQHVVLDLLDKVRKAVTTARSAKKIEKHMQMMNDYEAQAKDRDRKREKEKRRLKRRRATTA